MRVLETEDDLERYCPVDPSVFGTWVRLSVGPEGEIGAESFDVLICTPDWLKTESMNEDPKWGRHLLITREYDFDLIRKKIESFIDACVGDNWQEVAQKLSRIAAWEFEDYRPYRPTRG